MSAKYIKTKEAAEHLQLSRRYLEELRRTGGGPEFATFGRAVRYKLEALENWASSRTHKSTSDRKLE